LNDAEENNPAGTSLLRIPAGALAPKKIENSAGAVHYHTSSAVITIAMRIERPFGFEAGLGGKNPKAFTLAELLVVIAIIGILAAILLPVLASSKAHAQQTLCLGQTKQLSMALQMYAQDNRDLMPWPNWGNSNPTGWLYTAVDGSPPAPSTPPETVYQGGLLWSYIKIVKVYWCPVDNTNTSYFQGRGEQLSSYIMNGAIMGYYHQPPATPFTHKLSAMNPSAYATWEPSDQPPYDPGLVFNDGASNPNSDEGPAKRHSTGCNVTAFDGHAQFLKFDIFEQEQNDKPGLLWCDPDTAQGNGGSQGRDCSLWQ
jgi:prepilin-type N-terminal cleavage/methylation domain-containing protein/prepilin-type processing-associated H-X9-DG protein